MSTTESFFLATKTLKLLDERPVLVTISDQLFTDAEFQSVPGHG